MFCHGYPLTHIPTRGPSRKDIELARNAAAILPLPVTVALLCSVYAVSQKDRLYFCLFACMYIHMYVYLFLYICIYIYIYICVCLLPCSATMKRGSTNSLCIYISIYLCLFVCSIKNYLCRHSGTGGGESRHSTIACTKSGCQQEATGRLPQILHQKCKEATGTARRYMAGSAAPNKRPCALPAPEIACQACQGARDLNSMFGSACFKQTRGPGTTTKHQINKQSICSAVIPQIHYVYIYIYIYFSVCLFYKKLFV